MTSCLCARRSLVYVDAATVAVHRLILSTPRIGSSQRKLQGLSAVSILRNVYMTIHFEAAHIAWVLAESAHAHGLQMLLDQATCDPCPIGVMHDERPPHDVSSSYSCLDQEGGSCEARSEISDLRPRVRADEFSRGPVVVSRLWTCRSLPM